MKDTWWRGCSLRARSYWQWAHPGCVVSARSLSKDAPNLAWFWKTALGRIRSRRVWHARHSYVSIPALLSTLRIKPCGPATADALVNHLYERQTSRIKWPTCLRDAKRSRRFQCSPREYHQVAEHGRLPGMDHRQRLGGDFNALRRATRLRALPRRHGGRLTRFATPLYASSQAWVARIRDASNAGEPVTQPWSL